MSGSITLMVGLPGCGKSTFLEHCTDSVVLCPDHYRKVLTGQDYFAPAEDSVWSHVKVTARVMVGICHKHIVIDATHLTVGSRAQWIRIAKSLEVPISCVVFHVPYEVCLERNNARNRVVPEDIMEHMRDLFEPPTEEEGFQEIRQAGIHSDNDKKS